MRTQTSKTSRKKASDFSKNETNSIVVMFLSGFLPEEIAPEFFVNPNVIRAVLEECGYKADRYHYDEDTVSEWVKLYASKDKTISYIADKYETSPGTVRFHLARRGVKIKHPAFYRQSQKRKKKKVH